MTEPVPEVEQETPEQTDNSVRDDDGVQDVDQSPTPTPGSPA